MSITRICLKLKKIFDFKTLQNCYFFPVTFTSFGSVHNKEHFFLNIFFFGSRVFNIDIPR